MGEINKLLQQQLRQTEASLSEQQRLLQEKQQAEERRRTEERLEVERRLCHEERQKEIAKILAALAPENEAARKSARLLVLAPVLEGLCYVLAKLFEQILRVIPPIGALGVLVFGAAFWVGVVVAPLTVIYALFKLLGSLGRASTLKNQIAHLESID